VSLHIAKLDFDDFSTLTKSIEDLVTVQCFAGARLGHDQQLFELGLDPLNATRLARALKAALEEHNPGSASKMTVRTIYEFPTIHGLATAIMRLSQGSDDRNSLPTKEQRVGEVLERYYQKLAQIPQSSTNNKAVPTQGATIILTGSTGSLGSYVLDRLIRDGNV
jgi:FlaA1/EpsC-like NDP-sugar epimerase